jgi:membrane associated rhomboid family serine protease
VIPLHDDNPTGITPFVTIALIVACVLVFLWQAGASDVDARAAIFSYGVIPAVLLGPASLTPELAVLPAPLTILTSMFLHGGWMHLGGNMLYLWLFGNNVEDAMGHVRFVIFYLVCGAAAALAQAFAAPLSEIPMIGASGAISGVLGAYVLLHPRARILTLIFLGFFVTMLRLPAVIVLGFWILIQLFNAAIQPTDVGGVAFLAHVGGFIAGIALIGVFKRRDVPFLDRGVPRHAQARRWDGRVKRGPWDK